MALNKFMTAGEAIELIKDGDVVGINAFLTIANPEALHNALYDRAKRTGHPKNLTMFCAGGFGNWNEDSYSEPYMKLGIVDKVVASHYASMPYTSKAILKGEIEGYNLPLGVMAHMLRAAAGKKPGVLTEVGLNLFCDPRNGGGKLNDRCTDEWVELMEVNGRDMLFYKTPCLDVALIKATTSDNMGNISFEKECATIDALALAQAVKANGGKVIVQVERISSKHQRPRNVIVPGILVDAVVVSSEQPQISGIRDYNPSFSGDVFVPPHELGEWIERMERAHEGTRKRDNAHGIIARRALRELKAGMVVNIGIGIPEQVAVAAARTGLLRDVTLTVESGAIGGLPASGYSFGATVGADSIYDMSQQFDFYDGGGLDICFVGALEADAAGNVNSHHNPARISGIGGFANLTQSTPNVVFCFTFTAGGLVTEVDGDTVRIVQEGKYPKFLEHVSAVSFSAKNALNTGQNILYVTERCAFRLTQDGLELIELAKGIDLQKDVLDKLPFKVRISENLTQML